MKTLKRKRQHEQNEDHRIYLDCNATTPLEKSVATKISNSLTALWANPSSSYKIGQRARHEIETARQHVADLIHCSDKSEIIFMSGGTEANNHVFHIAVEYFNEGEFSGLNQQEHIKPHIISTTIEHDSVLHVVKYLEQKGVIDLSLVEVNKELGCICADDVIACIRENTVMVSVMMANNETGIIQPIEDICKAVTEVNDSRSQLPQILLHTDAAQAIGKVEVDVERLGVDYLTIVGHKFYAPRIGALYVRDGVPFHPLLQGGGQEGGRRAGTENTPMIIGLGEAARLVVNNLPAYKQHLKMIRDYLETKLVEEFGQQVVFNGKHVTCERLPNTCNFSLIGDELHGIRVLERCHYLQASVGAACHSGSSNKPSEILLAQHVHENVARNAIRLSVGRATTTEQIDVVVADLRSAMSRVASALLTG